MHQYLEQQADAVEAVLQAHGVAGRVRGGTLSPRLIRFHLVLPVDVRLAQLGQVLPAVAARLDVGAVRVSGDRGAGKSALLRSMALSLGLHNGPDMLRLLLIDLSGPARRGHKT